VRQATPTTLAPSEAARETVVPLAATVVSGRTPSPLVEQIDLDYSASNPV